MSKKVHKHILYEAAVQDPAVDIGLIDRMTAKSGLGRARTLREDFCGTALLACAWAHSDPDREAWGVDLHAPTLAWGRKHRVDVLQPEDAARVHLLEMDVLAAETPKVDAVAALNFSYMIFRERPVLQRYFASVFDSLNPGGVFMLDLFGGPHAQEVMKEKKKIPAGEDWAGVPHPAFTYVWDQARFNAVDQRIRCRIHFRGKHIRPMENAFTYDWRLWGLMEIVDLLREVGFSSVDRYFEGWDDEAEDTDGDMRIRTRYEDMLAWICYIGATRPLEPSS